MEGYIRLQEAGLRYPSHLPVPVEAIANGVVTDGLERDGALHLIEARSRRSVRH